MASAEGLSRWAVSGCKHLGGGSAIAAHTDQSLINIQTLRPFLRPAHMREWLCLFAIGSKPCSPQSQVCPCQKYTYTEFHSPGLPLFPTSLQPQIVGISCKQSHMSDQQATQGFGKKQKEPRAGVSIASREKRDPIIPGSPLSRTHQRAPIIHKCHDAFRTNGLQ